MSPASAGPAFAAAANAALNTTLNPPFSPYADDLLFLHGAWHLLLTLTLVALNLLTATFS